MVDSPINEETRNPANAHEHPAKNNGLGMIQLLFSVGPSAKGDDVG